MTQPFFAYMLECSDKTFYIGHTDNLEHRIAQHQRGAFPGYTHTLRPMRLVWSQDFQTRDDAFRAEMKIKGWSRRKKQALIAGDGNAIHMFASCARVPKPLSIAGLGCDPSRRGSAPPQDERALGEIPLILRKPEAVSKGPIIVLVRPQLGENIGKAARAMLNFGLTELRLVEPRDGWPNPSAGPAAAGADDVLARATVHPTLADAVADCAHVYATTVRKRGVTKPVLTPEQAAHAIHRDVGRSALVFGPERSGLETDDVALARAIVTVPVNRAFGSLNLAQAVILCAYEWSKFQDLAQPPLEALLPPAPQEELEGMIAQLDAMLEPRGYYHPSGRSAATRRTLRGLLTKPGWTHFELRTFRGVLTHLSRQPRGD